MNLKNFSFILLMFIFIIFISSVNGVNAVNLDSNMTLDESSHNFMVSDMCDYGSVSSEFEISGNVSNHIVEHDVGIQENLNNSLIKKLNNSLAENNCNLSNPVFGQDVGIQENLNSSLIKSNGNVSSSGNNITPGISINQTSDNSFDVTFNNANLKVYRLYVSDLKSYNDAMNFISRKDLHYDSIIIDFKHNLILNFKDLRPFRPESVKSIIIRGNGVKFDGLGEWKTSNLLGSTNTPKKYFIVRPGYSLILKDLTITASITPIVNEGKTTLDHVILDFNMAKHMGKKSEFIFDNGGAIFNHGVLECRDCVFSNNGAMFGGAVYNDKNSNSIFIDCKFSGNWAKGKIVETIGSDYHDSDLVMRACDLNNIYTDDLAHCTFFDSDVSNGVTFLNLNIKNFDDFKKALTIVKQLGHVHNLCLNFTKGVYEIPNDFEGINFEYVENLFIKGNGAQFKVKNSDPSKDCHFLILLKHRNCIMKNITLNGFNKAIINKGSLTIYDYLFKYNKCDYYVSKDYGGSIYNHKSGVVYLDRAKFYDGYAKYGGAIYNDHGQIIANNCVFKNNHAYDDGGVIYNEYGYVKFTNCSYNYNVAKSEGGVIFNHYGSFVSIGDKFDNCLASESGSAIYNDFGNVVLYNDTFINPDKDFLLNYGKEVKIVSINSTEVHNTNDGIKVQNITVSNDAPNEIARTAVRVGEAVAAVIVGAVVVLSPLKPAAQAAVCFALGAIMAAGEELYEECYLDHNFNLLNCLAMSLEAGVIDAISSHLIDTIISDSVRAAYPRISKFLVFGLELTEEVLTEFVPRFDLTDTESNEIPYNGNNVNVPQGCVLNTIYLKAILFNVPMGFTLNLYNDYVVGSSPVEINQNSVIIDGHGHTIKFTQDGGYVFYSSWGNVVLKNLIIDGNGYHGGVVGSSGHYILENCTIRNFVLEKPTSTFNGYAVLKGLHYTLKNCLIDNNKAYMGDTKITNGKSKGECYIIHCDYIDVDNCTFMNNRAKIGGAIYCLNNANIKNSKFISNEADKAAAAIFGNKITIDNSLFRLNKALLKEVFIEDRQDVGRDDYGGAITATGDIIVSNSMFDYNHAGKKGGAINTKGSATLTNVVFSRNDAIIDGGAIYSSKDVFANNCSFISNRADGSKIHKCWGGAIRACGDVKIKYCNFINNFAENSGGAIYADTVTFLSAPCLFMGNVAYKTQGGAIYTNKLTYDVQYAIFINNAASKTGSSDDGGAIYVNSENHITFSNCIFINNYCSDEGGAMYFDSVNSHVTLHDNIFINNKAGDQGQDIFNKGKYGTIKNNYWSKNPAESNDQLVEWIFNPFKSNKHHSDSSSKKLNYDTSGVLKNDELKIKEFISYVFKYVFHKFENQNFDIIMGQNTI